MLVKVYNNDISKAIRVLKKKLQEDGLYKDAREKQFYEKPSDRKRREKSIAIKREKRRNRARLEEVGF